MATYVHLINWTEQGIHDYANTLQRATSASEAAERLGGHLAHIYWTVGPYDIVAISEFPDDETATAFLLGLGAGGNVRTNTLRGYTAEEMSLIVGKTR